MSNVVPEGWNEPRVRDLFTLNTKSVVPNDSPQEKFTYFSLPAYDEFGTSVEVYGSEIESNKFEINDASVLVSKLNPRKPRVMYAKPVELRACASTEFMSFVPIKSNGVSLNYFTHYFFSELFQKRLELVATGSTNSHVRVSPKETTNWRIAVPPLPEQKKIASILTSVDEVIENTQKQIDKLQDLKKATMNELLTKGIGHTEFKDSELGRIPKSWEVVKLSGLCSLHYGKSPKEIEDDDGMYPIYGTGGIVGKTNSALHAGKSIVIGRKGSIDNVSFVDSPFWAIDTTYYVEGKNVEMKWLFYRLQYEGLKKYNEASGVPSLSRDTLYSIAIQSPPASEQTQICVILDTVESQISSLDIKLHQTQSLKKSLMQDLLTGTVRVTVN